MFEKQVIIDTYKKVKLCCFHILSSAVNLSMILFQCKMFASYSDLLGLLHLAPAKFILEI